MSFPTEWRRCTLTLTFDKYRPDIKAVRTGILASKSDVSAARKAFFPSIVIGGNGGFNAFDLDKWFTAPASLVYNLGAGITAPIFKQNTIRALWKYAKASNASLC